jgi:hypothetical protein
VGALDGLGTRINIATNYPPSIKLPLVHREGIIVAEKSTHEQKYHLGLAGEYFVAAELLRRGLVAAVTYGNAKRADVLVFSHSSEKALAVEVKSTSKDEWIVGPKVPIASDKPWVFVHVPVERDSSPSYYILTQAELEAVLKVRYQEYFKNYKQRHGEEYGDRASFINLKLKEAKCYLNAWQTITKKLLP